MPQLTHAQERTLEALDRTSTDMQAAVSRALGPDSPEARAILDTIQKARGAAIQALLAPPKDAKPKRAFPSISWQ